MKLSFGEKVAFGLGDAGCNFVWSTMSFFLMVYLTDSVGLAAATVGTIIFVSRLLDGITDLTMGAIIDKTNTPAGKARPWILRSAPFLSLGLIALFNVPMSLSYTGKVIYVSIAYIFVAAFAYTAANLSYSTLLSLISDDQNERTTATTYRFICTSITVILISMITPRLVQYISISTIAIIYGIFAFCLLLVTYFFTKERVITDGKSKERSNKENIKLLFKNKYFIRITLLFVTIYSANGLIQSSGIYFAKDVLGDAKIFGTITLLNSLPPIIIMFFLPSVVRKFGKWKLMMVGLSLEIVGTLIIALSLSIPAALYLGVIVRGVGNTPIIIGLFAIVADIVDYGEWKTGERIEGLTFSATSFGMKVGSGLGTAMVGWLLALGQYASGATVQSEYTIHFISGIYILGPIAIFAISGIILSTLNLDKIYDKIITDLTLKRKNSAS